MVCPHCRKRFQREVTDEAIDRAMKLKRKGLSNRQVSEQLALEGIQIGHSTIWRAWKGLRV